MHLLLFTWFYVFFAITFGRCHLSKRRIYTPTGIISVMTILIAADADFFTDVWVT